MPSTTIKPHPMPAGWKPDAFSVICCRGKIAQEHEGNRTLKALVKQSLPVYKDPLATKQQRSSVVTAILKAIRSSGAFVKYENDGWNEVGDRFAREKIGQMFRDALHTTYKSSSKAKKRRRRMEEGLKQSENELPSLFSNNNTTDDSSNLQTAPRPTEALSSTEEISSHIHRVSLNSEDDFPMQTSSDNFFQESNNADLKGEEKSYFPGLAFLRQDDPIVNQNDDMLQMFPRTNKLAPTTFTSKQKWQSTMQREIRDIMNDMETFRLDLEKEKKVVSRDGSVCSTCKQQPAELLLGEQTKEHELKSPVDSFNKKNRRPAIVPGDTNVSSQTVFANIDIEPLPFEENIFEEFEEFFI